MSLMSSSDISTQKVQLKVNADSGETEIFVVDGKFRRVAKGIGSLNIDLPPGLYDIKFKAGSTVNEVQTVLERGQQEVNVSGPPMYFSSPMPLPYTSTMYEYHQRAAINLSRQAQETLGEGSQIFVFTRELEGHGPYDTMAGLTLHALSGEELFDFSGKGFMKGYPESQIGQEKNPWAGYTIGVEPGLYRLRVHVSHGDSIEGMVVASKGWQTQVFLTMRDYIPEAQPQRYPDLTDMSVFMARPGQGFDPGNRELRLTELARQGLANRRNVVSKEDLGEMLWAKYGNPMLGIYGAHLLLLSPEPDLSLLKVVTENLHGLVGDHPDVQALAIYLAEKGIATNFAAYTTYTAPPMLRSSWDIILKATSAKPGLVPLDSLASQIWNRLWGYSPWLIWQTPIAAEVAHAAFDKKAADALPKKAKFFSLSPKPVPSPPSEKAEETRILDKIETDGIRSRKLSLEALGQVALQIGKVASSRRELDMRAENAGLAPIEQELLGYILDVVRPGTPSQFRQRQLTSADERLSPNEVVRSLGIPASLASAALQGLVNKLGLSIQTEHQG